MDVDLSKKRFVDSEVETKLLSMGWSQISTLDGLQWCIVCGRGTIWLDSRRRPMHHMCMDGLDSNGVKKT